MRQTPLLPCTAVSPLAESSAEARDHAQLAAWQSAGPLLQASTPEKALRAFPRRMAPLDEGAPLKEDPLFPELPPEPAQPALSRADSLGPSAKPATPKQVCATWHCAAVACII